MASRPDFDDNEALPSQKHQHRLPKGAGKRNATTAGRAADGNSRLLFFENFCNFQFFRFFSIDFFRYKGWCRHHVDHDAREATPPATPGSGLEQPAPTPAAGVRFCLEWGERAPLAGATVLQRVRAWVQQRRIIGPTKVSSAKSSQRFSIALATIC